MFFKLWNKITSIFRSKQVVSLIFSHDINNKIVLHLKYHNKNNAEDVASIIYALSHGLFLDKIVNILLDDLKDHPKDITYKILSHLDLLYVADRKNDLIIKPLEAFDKNVKQ